MALANGLTPRLGGFIMEATISELEIFGLIDHLYTTQPGGVGTPVYHVFIDRTGVFGPPNSEYRKTARTARRWLTGPKMQEAYRLRHRRYDERTLAEQVATDNRRPLATRSAPRADNSYTETIIYDPELDDPQI